MPVVSDYRPDENRNQKSQIKTTHLINPINHSPHNHNNLNPKAAVNPPKRTLGCEG